MNSLINKALKLLIGDDVNFDLTRIPKNRPLKPLTERELLKLESAIGAELFGPVPQGHRREFFVLTTQHGFGTKNGLAMIANYRPVR